MAKTGNGSRGTGASGNGNGNGEGAGAAHQFAPGDIVLGKIKGYPPWPGILCHEDKVPKANVLSARPGKNYHIVRFFPAADYGFNRSHELRRLTKREVEAFLSDPHKRAAELREAYKLALNPEAWNAEQDEAVRQAEEEDEGKDMLAEEEDDEDDDVQPAAAKKRKASKASSAAANKKTKSAASAATAAATATSSITKSTGRTDSADADAGEEVELDPETKKVKGWRHTLQRGFLPKDGNLAGEDMEQHDRTFKQVEEYQSITVAQLRLTKIGKVMKRIAQLPSIPRDDEFHFRKRAQTLCETWGELLAGGGSSGGGGGGGEEGNADVKEPVTASTANGASNGERSEKDETSIDAPSLLPPASALPAPLPAPVASEASPSV